MSEDTHEGDDHSTKAEAEQGTMAALAVVTIDTKSGTMGIRPSPLVGDRLAFFVTLGELAIKNAKAEYTRREQARIEQQATKSKVLRPGIRLPGDLKGGGP